MKIYHSLNDFAPEFRVVLTIGTFDGVHIGHQSILESMNDVAKKIGGESVMLTFYPHPKHVIYPDDDQLKLLSTIDEKSAMLQDYGLQHLIIQSFDNQFSRIRSVNFVRDILVNRLKISTLIIGYDHHFGRNREGNLDDLVSLSKIYDYDVLKIDPKKYNNISVSSTKIRALISEGNIDLANNYLNHPFLIQGTVVKGRSLGKEIGFPTANININNKWKLLPPYGVYSVEVDINEKTHFGMMNIGINPTFDDADLKIEVHIFDFDQNIYGQEIQIFIISRVRDERKFKSLDELKNQLSLDEKCIREIFNKKYFSHT